MNLFGEHICMSFAVVVSDDDVPPLESAADAIPSRKRRRRSKATPSCSDIVVALLGTTKQARQSLHVIQWSQTWLGQMCDLALYGFVVLR